MNISWKRSLACAAPRRPPLWLACSVNFDLELEQFLLVYRRVLFEVELPWSCPGAGTKGSFTLTCFGREIARQNLELRWSHGGGALESATSANLRSTPSYLSRGRTVNAKKIVVNMRIISELELRWSCNFNVESTWSCRGVPLTTGCCVHGFIPFLSLDQYLK